MTAGAAGCATPLYGLGPSGPYDPVDAAHDTLEAARPPDDGATFDVPEDTSVPDATVSDAEAGPDGGG